MKFLLPILFLFCNTIAIGQTKEDIIDCLDVIFSQDEFQPAFSNNVGMSGGVVIVSDRKRRLRDSDISKIRSQLTQDDFYDFNHSIKVVHGGSEELEQMGIPIQYTLEFFLNGTEENLLFRLSTSIRDDADMRYLWNYKMVKENDEWTVAGQNFQKRKQ